MIESNLLQFQAHVLWGSLLQQIHRTNKSYPALGYFYQFSFHKCRWSKLLYIYPSEFHADVINLKKCRNSICLPFSPHQQQQKFVRSATISSMSFLQWAILLSTCIHTFGDLCWCSSMLGIFIDRSTNKNIVICIRFFTQAKLNNAALKEGNDFTLSFCSKFQHICTERQELFLCLHNGCT